MRTAELVDQTNRFLDLLETGNRAGMADMLDDQVVWSAPMFLVEALLSKD